jgi:hypothetical protein
MRHGITHFAKIDPDTALGRLLFLMTVLFLLVKPTTKQNLRSIFMPKHFYKNIKPFVEQELILAKQARKQSDFNVEFTHLENAHVLGQASTLLHTKVHILMLFWAVRQVNIKEGLGQVMRIVGAATKTAIGFIPSGNTGGTNVSPFKVLAVSPKLASILAKARSSTQTH